MSVETVRSPLPVPTADLTGVSFITYVTRSPIFDGLFGVDIGESLGRATFGAGVAFPEAGGFIVARSDRDAERIRRSALLQGGGAWRRHGSVLEAASPLGRSCL